MSKYLAYLSDLEGFCSSSLLWTCPSSSSSPGESDAGNTPSIAVYHVLPQLRRYCRNPTVGDTSP